MQPREFKVEIVSEGALGTVLFGASNLPVRKMEAVMNRYGRDGWDVTFMLLEKKRTCLFWDRESAVITFSRPLAQDAHHTAANGATRAAR
jgi:hypothetical protein